MKNIHLIHVNRAKASLYHCSNTRDFFTTEQTSSDLLYELYITSDETPNKMYEGFYLLGNKVFNTNTTMLQTGCKAIILTTDPKLIEDGVQAIDDEFLEWFVKNPSCESVDINRDWGYPKIIIPKEEPGQETLEEAAMNWDYLSFEAGAKWQAERMFSEEEVENILFRYAEEEHAWFSCKSEIDSFNKWLKQFKKK